MRAVLVEQFGLQPTVLEVAPPACRRDDVVLRVEATGLCRSDWHGWQGHDPDIKLPHIPGHEIAGTILRVGAGVRRWSIGQRVTVPFVCACGVCPECRSGNGQTCRQQQQPGFTYWGSFAEEVAVPNADVNLVELPVGLSFVAAAALGCRLATAYRAVHDVARIQPGESVAVLGCGGVGLSAVMIAASLGAHVIAIDPNPDALALARRHGAAETVSTDIDALREKKPDGMDVTVDALGSPELVTQALKLLRPRGRHIQIGLLPGLSSVDLGPVISGELRVLGSHGMAAQGYPRMLADIAAGILHPTELVTGEIGLNDVPAALAAMSAGSPTGITVIRPRLS